MLYISVSSYYKTTVHKHVVHALFGGNITAMGQYSIITTCKWPSGTYNTVIVLQLHTALVDLQCYIIVQPEEPPGPTVPPPSP